MNKPIKLLKTLPFYTVLFLFSVNLSAAPSSLKGVAAISRILSERTLVDGNILNLSILFGVENSYWSMLDLMGSYKSDQGEVKFKNGKPNSINTLLWKTAFTSLAKEMAKECNPLAADKIIHFNVYFKESLRPLCKWPNQEAMQEKVLQNIWLSIMAYDAPLEEYEAWRDFFLHSSFAHKSAYEAVPAILFSILYNPHFMLRK
ncbi:MAG: hypothetical protein M9962_05835 [Oligoflexia bacterium]|nr:hypothetical protein [Oligoflexia bacterium]